MAPTEKRKPVKKTSAQSTTKKPKAKKKPRRKTVEDELAEYVANPLGYIWKRL